MMSPSVRTLALAAHLTVSIGWLGALAAYTALDVWATTSDDVQTLRAAYLGMDLIARNVILPLATAGLITGLVVSLGTKWGLFRHYWVVISLALTTVATVVLVIELATIERMADLARAASTSPELLRSLGGTLAHSLGGTIVLLVVLVLNIYKPQGITPYGWRKQQGAAGTGPARGSSGA